MKVRFGIMFHLDMVFLYIILTYFIMASSAMANEMERAQWRKTTNYCILTRYEGEWANDYYHGRGTKYISKNTVYEGQFMYGKFEGYGSFVKSDHYRYEGDFYDNNFHGYGILTRLIGHRLISI